MGTFSAFALAWPLFCLPPQEKQEITSGSYPSLGKHTLASQSARFIGPFWGRVQEAGRDQGSGRNASGVKKWAPLAPASVPSSPPCPHPTPHAA